MTDESRAVGTLGGWALGANAKALPDGLAFFVPKEADLVLSTHFHPSGKVEHEASTIGLYFAAAAPTQAFAGLALPPLFGVFEGIDIPPGEKEYTIRDSFVLPVDVKAFNVGAHAHYLARRMKLSATFPDGTTKTLLQIDDWDFAWQDQYPFEQFVALPKGTRLDGWITYDNSPGNPRNPSNPPKRVTWGEQSTDEMGSVGLLVVAAREDDMPTLQQVLREPRAASRDDASRSAPADDVDAAAPASASVIDFTAFLSRRHEVHEAHPSTSSGQAPAVSEVEPCPS